MIVSQKELILGAISGKVISFPTDTVPALASFPNHCDNIYHLKKRSQDKPLILMAASFNTLKPYLQGTPEEMAIWQQIAEEYWPGALTLVLPASDLLPKSLNPTDSQTIGVRVPNLPLALAILQETGPLATTSANLSGQPPLMTMGEISQAFPEVLALDQDFSGSGQPSTVVKWTGENWQILRQGTVNLS